jgi:predicted transcriptional regulator
MARRSSPQLTEAELRIMTVLWAKGPSSIQDVTDVLRSQYGLAYTTVLTTMRIMARKAYVDFRAHGRAHVYWPLVSQSGYRRTAVQSLLGSFFGGSSHQLAHYLVDSGKLTLGDIEELKSRFILRRGVEEDRD